MNKANEHTMIAVRAGTRSTWVGILVNVSLAIIKGCAGVLGHSHALIADAIESAADSLTSLVVLFGLKMASRPADKNHPYGHGKFEPLAAAVVALMMLAAAMLIAITAIEEIKTPHQAPASFTLLVLLIVIGIKEWAFKYVIKVAEQTASSVVRTDAWHHRSDAITSFAAFIGISIALLGGPAYASADDFAALIAGAIIAANAYLLLKPALYELIDTAPHPELAKQIQELACSVSGVLGTHKCHVRKLGFDYFVDLDVLCNPNATIREGHEVAHNVGEALHRKFPQIAKVLVHVEPVDDYGRRSRD